MWAAFTAKLGAWFTKIVLPYLLKYFWDHLQAWNERRLKDNAQKKEDETTNQTYDEAIKHGTKEEIRRATEDRFNS
jgi:hypothetical protein